jgi:hypothetical protein
VLDETSTDKEVEDGESQKRRINIGLKPAHEDGKTINAPWHNRKAMHLKEKEDKVATEGNAPAPNERCATA